MRRAAWSPGATVRPSASSGHAPAVKTSRAGGSTMAAYADAYRADPSGYSFRDKGSLEVTPVMPKF